MPPVGFDHASDNGIIFFAVNLFCTLKGIPLRGLITCSYRKVSVRECQPDVSYYIGERAKLALTGTSAVDLNSYPAPDLVIEVANTSLSDDIGNKRLLYEAMEVSEYWVVDVQNTQSFCVSVRPWRSRRQLAAGIADGGSKRITQSQVLPGLDMALLEETLRRSRQMDNTQVGAWLPAQIQKES